MRVVVHSLLCQPGRHVEVQNLHIPKGKLSPEQMGRMNTHTRARTMYQRKINVGNKQHARRVANHPVRPLLLLGGVADALNEALLVVRGAEGMSAARAAEACEDALKLLKQELKEVQEMQTAQETQTAETPSPGDQSNLSLD